MPEPLRALMEHVNTRQHSQRNFSSYGKELSRLVRNVGPPMLYAKSRKRPALASSGNFRVPESSWEGTDSGAAWPRPH